MLTHVNDFMHFINYLYDYDYDYDYEIILFRHKQSK